MNQDDESYLSAYLDDELDPADRLAVIWSVETSPASAEQLRALATARDAVAGLGRPPAARDLAPAVVAHLSAARRRSLLRALARPGRVAAAVACLMTMAASLAIALVLLHRSTHPLALHPEIALESTSSPAPRNHPIDPIATPPAPPSTSVASLLVPPTRPEARPAAGPDDEGREREVRRRVDRMLGSPDVRRVLIVTDEVGASDRIRDLIRQDARKDPDFARIRIATGIVLDPARPEEAEVFAVVLDEPGCGPFLDRLQGIFPGMEVEGEASPALVTQLTEVGRVAIFPGIEASPLVDPPAGVATLGVKQDAPKPDIYDLHAPDLVGAGRAPEGPVPPVVRAGPAIGREAVVGPGPAGPGLVTRADGPVTLLVWVTRPGRP